MPEDAEEYHLNPDGTLMVLTRGADDWTQVGSMQLARFANAEGLEHIGRGVYATTVVSGEAQLGVPGQGGNGSLIAGSLEDSSVDLSEEMVDLIVAQRIYSLGLKIVQTADEMQYLANQLLGR